MTLLLLHRHGFFILQFGVYFAGNTLTEGIRLNPSATNEEIHKKIDQLSSPGKTIMDFSTPLQMAFNTKFLSKLQKCLLLFRIRFPIKVCWHCQKYSRG